MGDDGGCSFEEFELRRIADDDGIAWWVAEASGVESAAKREYELEVEAGARFRDRVEDISGAVLKGAEGGINKRTAIEFVPGEVDRGSLLLVHEGPV